MKLPKFWTLSATFSTKHVTIPKSFLSMSSSSSSSSDDRAVQVGLTGSIGMGKSTISNHFKSMGFPVFDADATVHRLYAVNGAAVAPIEKLYPDTIVDGAVHRPTLGKKVIEDSTVLKVLEAIVHPLVAAERKRFYEEANNQGHFLVVYDIPLLLENPSSQEVDYVLVATASAETQKHRVLDRPGMTEEKFLSLLAKQMPDEEKRKKANFLIDTDHPSKAPAKAQVASIVENLVGKHGKRWNTWKNRHHHHHHRILHRKSDTTPTNKDPSSTDTSQSTDMKPNADLQSNQILSTSSSVTTSSLAHAFDLIVFDLDDTLVPVWHPIKPATEALMSYMGQHMPNAAIDAQVHIHTCIIYPYMHTDIHTYIHIILVLCVHPSIMHPSIAQQRSQSKPLTYIEIQTVHNTTQLTT